METIRFQGTTCHTIGFIPVVGSHLPTFELVDPNLNVVTYADFKGERLVLNIFPSLDTSVCAASVRRFNTEATSLPSTKVLCVSMDLPFAAKRFCSTEGINNLTVASAFRSTAFAHDYGLRIVDGPLAGLLARAVIIADASGKIIYRELVDEIIHEPNYKAALEALQVI